jgi:hypothetical protein
MDMSQPISYLFENELGIRFLEFAFPLNESQEVTASGVLHYHEQMLA